jgi:RNA polymerase sigma-70 factor (ECF subfamily)
MPAESVTDEELRPLMFSIAYRMVGGIDDAEEIVQEAYLRLAVARKEGQELESAKAFLVTVTTRLAIDHLRSARVRREQYVGPWMPEPLVSEEPGPAERAETADSLSLAFMVLLERLSPRERAVYLLREAFDFPYAEIAEIVDVSEGNARQIASRAADRIEDGRPRFEPSLEEREELAERFLSAFERGDIEQVLELVAPDVVFVGDGGGKATAIPEPVHGRDRVGTLLKAFANQARRWSLTLESTLVNGQPGAIVRDPQGRVTNVVCLDIAGGAVQAVRSIVNPDKLSRLGEQSELTRLRRAPSA